MENNLTGTTVHDPEALANAKEWALERLAGFVRSYVRRIRSVPVRQVEKAEQFAIGYGVSEQETRARIYKTLAEVVNADPQKVAALMERFPKVVYPPSS